ncbi:formate dehydrogenase accessory protein [Sporotomaculum syntrophicum]|uniref:Sulfur carrier protein FdhD n=1 Tax=Sporotomaculum syntrophicum TaxID=182264 RepID=A0A9D2WRX1_9FIRM|nr:formate dehydrogenase accessory sulfurtransferase FdhD [Sporotomaculum syntrophicum]KAF1085801.1 formate dehydrogenase accessory protein [Sporotomaculum syntrophicum]
MIELTEAYTLIPVTRYRSGVFSTCEDKVIKEVPVNLILNNFEFSTMTCSPYDLKEMVIGFLYSEGLIQHSSDIKSITIDQAGKTVKVETTTEGVTEDKFVKRLVTTSCSRGGPSLYFFNSAKRVTPVSTDLKIKITPGEIFSLCNEVERNSPLFRTTGGSHSAALCTNEKILFIYEDVGRHNAVDKVAGHALLNNVTLSDKILIFSGRIASEILIKVAKMGIPLIAARSAPTELAVNLAKEFGITIVGFVRTDKFTIYSHEYRVVKNQ